MVFLTRSPLIDASALSSVEISVVNTAGLRHRPYPSAIFESGDC
jgi:hypothetical protein